MFVQVAGAHDLQEVKSVVSIGITHLALPLGPGVREQDVSLEKAGRMFRFLPAFVSGVVITYLSEAEEISGLCSRVGCKWVQLHGDILGSEVKRLRLIRSDLGIIKSLVVGKKGERELLEECTAFAPYCDMFITDTFDPQTGACGATGRIHDWEISRAVVRDSPRPVILAGGLGPDNVYQAVMHVRPAGVDAHTGLEDSRGRKDPQMVRRFVREARRAEQDLMQLKSG
ncbi:MAG: phosphoribosylanthranilate isomerase [Desulfonatronovibrionaceae bacterium]